MDRTLLHEYNVLAGNRSPLPSLTEAGGSPSIEEKPFVHPNTGWKDTSRVALKVPKSAMGSKEYAAWIKDMGLDLHPEFPNIIAGGAYQIAIVSREDWEKAKKTGKAAQAPAPGAAVEKPAVALPKLSAAEIAFLKRVKDAASAHSYKDAWTIGGAGHHNGLQIKTPEDLKIASKLNTIKYKGLALIGLYGPLKHPGEMAAAFGATAKQHELTPAEAKTADEVYAHGYYLDSFLAAHEATQGK